MPTTATKLTSAQLRVVATLGFCGLVSAADNWFVSPALPSIAAGLSVVPGAAAVVLTAYLVPYGTLQPVCGAVGDAVGRLWLLRAIVLGLAAGTLLCAVVPSLPLLVVARVVTGCFAAGIISVSQAFVGDVVGPRSRAGAVGILMGITFTGQGLSAGLGGILTDLVGWRAAFASFGALALVAWLLLFGLREPVRDEGDEAPAPTAADGSPVASFLGEAGRVLAGPGRPVFALACTTGVAFLGVYGLMGTFLAEACGLTATQAGLVMMLYGVLCLVGGASSGRLGARGGLSRVVSVGEASGVVAALALLASALSGSWAPSLLGAACLGLGYILVQPTLVTLSMDADPEHAGLCTGLVGLGVFAGGGAGSALGGLVLRAGGYPALWGVAALALAAQLVASRRLLAGR